MSKERVLAILHDAEALAREYYQLTGKPLGVTGKVAEYEAARLLGVELGPARQAGYDAIEQRTVPRITVFTSPLTRRSPRWTSSFVSPMSAADTALTVNARFGGSAVPVIHMMGAGLVGGRIANSSGVFFWVWTLIAPGVTATFSVILSARGR